MKTKVIRYSREHVHHYVYDANERQWRCVLCRMDGAMDRCTAGRRPLPRGTQFDGTGAIDAREWDYIEMQRLNAF